MQKKLYFISILIEISFLQASVAVTKVTSTSSLQKSTILGIAHLLAMEHYPQAGYIAIRESGRNFKNVEVEFVPMPQEDVFEPITCITSTSGLTNKTVHEMATLLSAHNYPRKGAIEINHTNNAQTVSIKFIPEELV